MTKLRTLTRPIIVILLWTAVNPALNGGGFQARAQQTAAAGVADDLTRGVELYKQGGDKEAIEVLRRVVKRNKNEIAAWHYLGLAYARQGKKGEARKAHEKSAKSGEWLLEQLYSSLPYEDVFTAAVKYQPLLLMAAESARNYLELSSKPSRSKAQEWGERAELLRDHAMPGGESGDGRNPSIVFPPREVETKARILTRPEPSYTEEARKNQVRGTVVLRAILAFDGKVRGIRVVSGLPDGLTFRAIDAVRKIKFIPATIKGKPVSQYVQIEYNFNIY
jgi:TonB family protein